MFFILGRSCCFGNDGKYCPELHSFAFDLRYKHQHYMFMRGTARRKVKKVRSSLFSMEWLFGHSPLGEAWWHSGTAGGQLASGARNTFWVIWVHLPAARIWRRTALRVSPIAGLSRHGAPSEPCPAPQKPSLWPCPLATRTSPSRTYVGSTSVLPPFFLRSKSVSFAEVKRRLYGGGTEVERR